MIHVGVKELKNHLSRYLKKAHIGETIRVTDRGKVIAVVTGVEPKTSPLLRTLHHLVDGERYHWNGRKPRGLSQKPGLTPGPALADLIAEDRR
jgi:prevent-host-death family protein